MGNSDNIIRHHMIRCRSCDHPLDAAISDDTDNPQIPPESGDFCVCFNCGTMSIYQVAADGTLSLRGATLLEKITFERYHGRSLMDLHRQFGVNRRPNG